MNGYKMNLEEYMEIRKWEGDMTPDERMIYPIIDPSVEIEFLSFVNPHIRQLRKPLGIREDEDRLQIDFEGGYVQYYFSKHGYYIPIQATIWGVVKEDGKPSLNTHMFDTSISFLTIEGYKDLEYKTETMQYLLIPDGPLLGIEIAKGQKIIPKDWWFAEKNR